MYTIKEGIVCRDIGGIFLVLDIHDKYLYRNHKIISVNASGYNFLTAMCLLKNFDSELLYNLIKNKFYRDIDLDKEKVINDIKQIICLLTELGWIYVV